MGITMKTIIIIMAMAIITSTIVLGAVTRSGNNDIVTYTSGLTGSYTKAYWAIEEDVSSCTVTGVSCSGANVGCSYANDIIRVVSYTPVSGGTLQSSVAVTVSGSGSCSLNNGQYVESEPGNLGGAISLSGSTSLTLSGGGCCNADSNCDSTITWSELDAYISNWALSNQVCGSLITWSMLDAEITSWAIQ
jgi:hypothetical protein